MILGKWGNYQITYVYGLAQSNWEMLGGGLELWAASYLSVTSSPSLSDAAAGGITFSALLACPAQSQIMVLN